VSHEIIDTISLWFGPRNFYVVKIIKDHTKVDLNMVAFSP